MAAVFGIGSAARLLRVPAATIRTWERRYGVVVPTRTRGGHRVYSHEQMEQLRYVAARLAEGMRPSEAHRLLREAGPASPAGARALELELPAAPQAPANARHALEHLAADQPDGVRFNLRLLVDELVGNSVRHAGSDDGATVRVRASRRDGRIQVQVIDRGCGFDWTRAPRAEGGRGLPLVAALADRWGLTFDRGTTAWFELELASGRDGSGSRDARATLAS
ncbi:MAG TPA: MerR family transcriptional regulator [Gaiellaceae bacterium]|nr:MerR family transcriptional regulator [Gaiellaceae bacterium]